MDAARSFDLVSTGVPGLDEVLHGGVARGAACLVEGATGTGKTTMGLQFCLHGIARGEPALYLALSEHKADLDKTAVSHGWTLDGIKVVEGITPAVGHTMFHPAEVELDEVMRRLMEEVARSCPARLVIDSLAEVRLMAQRTLRFRREVAAFRWSMTERGCTMLALDTSGGPAEGRALLDVVLRLEQTAPEYGPSRRRLLVLKTRARSFAGGYHDMEIGAEGVAVYPRLVAGEHAAACPGGTVSSGVAALDGMFAGGLARGTSTLILGEAGTGKSAVAMQFAASAARRGERAAVFECDEQRDTVLARSALIGTDVSGQVADGRLSIVEVDPSEMSLGRLANEVRREVEGRGAGVVVIDSLSGYVLGAPEEKAVVAQLHEMLAYMGRMGVSSFMPMALPDMATGRVTPASTSYLVDNVLLLRLFEAEGRIRKSISVVKTRGCPHDQTIRELDFGSDGIRISEPLGRFRGILTGAPTAAGRRGQSGWGHDARQQ